MTNCILADIGLATQTNGNMTICNHSRTAFLDEQGNPMRLDTHSLEQGWNSPTRKEIKQALDSGIKHANCRDCWDDEAAGRESIRLRSNEEYGHAEVIDQPRVFMFKPGNVCNLSCRHCNPYVSSKWYKDHWQATARDKMTFVEYVKQYDGIRDSYDQGNNNLWPVLKQWNDHIIFYDLYGAEPLLIDSLLDILRHSVTTGASKNQIIHINSNGTIWQDDFNVIFSNFKLVEMGVSIDGIYDQFEYMRYPAKWSNILQNINNYKNLQSNYTCINLSVCITVSLLNVYYLVEYMNYFSNMKLECGINIVHRPNYLNMRIAPDHIKQKIIDKLSSTPLLEKTWQFKIDQVINYLRLDYENRQDLMAEFWDYTNKYDSLREQSYCNYFPEFFKVLTNE